MGEKGKTIAGAAVGGGMSAGGGRLRRSAAPDRCRRARRGS